MTSHASSVVVTGIGLITGLGHDRVATWAAMRAGRCAIRPLDLTEFGPDRTFLGCPAPGVLTAPRVVEPALALLTVLVQQAAHDARIRREDRDPARTATLIGLSKGGIRSLARLHGLVRAAEDDPARIVQLWSRCWPNAGAVTVARLMDARGPCLAPVAACATGLVAVLQGADLIRRGVCDVAFAGSADASLEPILLAAFRRMKVLAHPAGDPSSAVRPWDRGRSGFVVGEGGAILVLERADGARARGVLPYAEVAGGALGSDAHHETNLNPDPAGLAGLIRRALDDAGVAPEEIDHVNVHGTATRQNDPLECRALRLALGPHADRVACSANKSQIGHLLGAAGSAELAVTCLAIRDAFVPPTLNLHDPDPECDLDGTPLVGRARPIRAALKLSIGFGGHLAAAVLRRPEGPRRGPIGAVHDDH
jgi:3-oxoacyl-[acyl-carrier-protein] synthase II